MDHAKKSLKVQVETNNVFFQILKGHAYLTASMTLVRGLLRKRERVCVCLCFWERGSFMWIIEREREEERMVSMCVIGREKEWEIYRETEWEREIEREIDRERDRERDR